MMRGRRSGAKHPRARKVVVITTAVLVVLATSGAIVLHVVVTGIAEDNLTNADFDRVNQTTPAELGLVAVDVAFEADGIPLRGWWLPAPDCPVQSGAVPLLRLDDEACISLDATIILVHGYSANKGKVLERWGPHLHGLGYSVLTFDLRNHGASGDDSGGYVSYGAAEYRDVLAAIDWVRENADGLGVSPDKLVLYGASMGAAAVVKAASMEPAGLRAIIFDSGYESLHFQAHVDGAEQGYPGFLIDWVVSRMDALAPAPPSSAAPGALLPPLGVPVLLAHCSNDTRVDAASHPRLAVAAPDAETWFHDCPVGLSEEHHVDGWMLADYNATIADFLGRHAGGEPAPREDGDGGLRHTIEWPPQRPQSHDMVPQRS